MRTFIVIAALAATASQIACSDGSDDSTPNTPLNGGSGGVGGSAGGTAGTAADGGGPIDECDDGTPLEQCSATSPLYCDGTGALVDDCAHCGPCAAGAFCNLPSGSCTVPDSGARLVHRSSFEEPVTITKTGNMGDSAFLHGADQGYDWDDFDHVFNYTCEDAENLGLVDTHFSEAGEPAHWGERSLFQAQYSQGCPGPTDPQNRLQFNGSDTEFAGEMFSSRWLYFVDPADSFDVDWEGTSIAGLRQHENNFSVWPSIHHHEGQVIWTLSAVNYNAGDYWSQWLLWSAENRDVPVPENRWFRLDYYVYRHETEGILRMWVDGELVFDVSPESPPTYHNFTGPGVTTRIGGSGSWFAKISDIDYSQTDGDPFEQFVDDVEVWAEGNPYGDGG